MTISAYQIDNVIKAYSKQSKARLRVETSLAGPATMGQSDLVTLHSKAGENDVYRKISYTLLDLLKK
jgi:hypothetical protein